MVITNSAESSSWDFTQVHDLLRSPTYGGALRPSRHTEPTASPAQEQQSKSIGNHVDHKPQSLSARVSDTKLGDFGSLWDLLNNGPAPVSPTLASVTTKSSLPGNEPTSTLDTLNDFVDRISSTDRPVAASPANNSTDHNVANVKRSDAARSTHSRRPSTPVRPVSILKRAVDEQCSGKNVNVKFDDPRTPTKFSSATDGSSSDTPKRKTKSKNRDNTKKSSTRNEPISSEGSAGVDSDSSALFDRPLPKRTGALAFVPAQVGTPEVLSDRYDTPPSSFDDQEWSLNTDTIRNGIRVRSTLYKSSTERRISLMTRLLKEYPGYAKIVSQVGQSVQSPPKKDVSSQPIHIFVDMSNIMIGFHDSVKASRSIAQQTRIRRVHMSFANLSLIMERGRQTAKRVLVGSDRLPSIDEAETLGYETNILDRVQKVKHITPRRNKIRKYPASDSCGISGGPETVAASGERWVEQGVDEILHLKILESLVDTDEPATIVLATGDAAVAEFSGGFMKMVERALQRGWIVELVSFAQGTSYAYRKKEFRAQWGDRFHIIELDPYVEELFE
ncbi:hypothetical protein N7452_002162 [Penicillium brevicompactum]|uniref:NYN domain-containing protein n=1 Tax=Penicillium brevicompactum TaxID=5074 RepID=A0A9W9R980_PENBR|nr:hypothetical protein N7452_002162 [Penicillium brevicompactum]